MTTDLTLALNDDLAARIKRAAGEAGVSPEVWAVQVLTDSLLPAGVREDGTTFDAQGPVDDLLSAQTPAYRQSAALVALDNYDRSGISYPLENTLGEVRADLETRLAAKG